MKKAILIDQPAERTYNLSALVQEHGEITMGRSSRNEIPLGKGLSEDKKREHQLGTVSSFNGTISYSLQGERFLFKDTSPEGTGLKRGDNMVFLRHELYSLRSGDELHLGSGSYGPVIYKEPRNAGEFTVVRE